MSIEMQISPVPVSTLSFCAYITDQASSRHAHTLSCAYITDQASSRRIHTLFLCLHHRSGLQQACPHSLPVPTSQIRPPVGVSTLSSYVYITDQASSRHVHTLFLCLHHRSGLQQACPHYLPVSTSQIRPPIGVSTLSSCVYITDQASSRRVHTLFLCLHHRSGLQQACPHSLPVSISQIRPLIGMSTLSSCVYITDQASSRRVHTLSCVYITDQSSSRRVHTLFLYLHQRSGLQQATA